MRARPCRTSDGSRQLDHRGVGVDRVSGLLRELAPRDIDQLLAGLDLALQHRPVVSSFFRAKYGLPGWPRRTSRRPCAAATGGCRRSCDSTGSRVLTDDPDRPPPRSGACPDRFDRCDLRKTIAASAVPPTITPARLFDRSERGGEASLQLSEVGLQAAPGFADLRHLPICCFAHRASSFRVSRVSVPSRRSVPHHTTPDEHEQQRDHDHQDCHGEDGRPDRPHQGERRRARGGDEPDGVHHHDGRGRHHPHARPADRCGLGHLELRQLDDAGGRACGARRPPRRPPCRTVAAPRLALWFLRPRLERSRLSSLLRSPRPTLRNRPRRWEPPGEIAVDASAGPP